MLKMEYFQKFVVNVWQNISKETIQANGICLPYEFPNDIINLTCSSATCCPADEAPTWKYLPKLFDFYHLSLWPLITLTLDYLLHVTKTIAGWRDLCEEKYLKYKNVIDSDRIFILALKIFSMLIFLIFMHWLKQHQTNNTSKQESQACSEANGSLTSETTTTTAAKQKQNSTKNENNNNKTNNNTINNNDFVAYFHEPHPIPPKSIICEFEFKTPSEIDAEKNAAANEAKLEVEEKKRHKRIVSKKRKCVSAGPVLVRNIRPKKHKHHAAKLTTADHEIPLRSKPLVFTESTAEDTKIINILVDDDEPETFNYMCVYFYYDFYLF